MTTGIAQLEVLTISKIIYMMMQHEEHKEFSDKTDLIYLLTRVKPYLPTLHVQLCFWHYRPMAELSRN